MHHKRDWKKYNKQLVNRGKVNVWVCSETLKNWQAVKQGKACRPFLYSDALIKAMIYVRFKFHLSLRETQGFFLSLIGLLNMIIKMPCYTQICRRMKHLQLPTELLTKRNVTDIILDTTGLKIYGEGEWRAEKYGGRKRWKKLHLALDPRSGKLVLAELTDEHTHDTAYLETALERSNGKKGKVLIDGIADNQRCYALAKRFNKVLLTPPKTGAVLRKEEVFRERNNAIRVIRSLGNDRIARSIWSKLTGYNRRVIIESMMSCWKRIHGAALKSRCRQRQKVEIRIKAEMINQIVSMAA